MNIRTDSDIKKQAEELFEEFGLSMTSAVNMFLRQAVREKSIPFNITLNTELRKEDDKRQRASWLKRLDTLTELSEDEELIYIPRSNEMRGPVDLS